MFDGLNGLIPVHDGHNEVHEDVLVLAVGDALVLDFSESFLTIVGNVYFEEFEMLGDELLQNHDIESFIVNDEDFIIIIVTVLWQRVRCGLTAAMADSLMMVCLLVNFCKSLVVCCILLISCFFEIVLLVGDPELVELNLLDVDRGAETPTGGTIKLAGGLLLE